MIIIDLSEFIPEEGIVDLAGFVRALRDIAEETRAEIIRQAQSKLGLSVEDYIRGLQPVEYSLPDGGPWPQGLFTAASIELVGWLPNAIEQGWPGGDMKEALLSGRNAKIGKDGTRFNTVPFRHGTPGTSGHNFPAMGSAHSDRIGPGGVPRKPLSRAFAGPMTETQAAMLGKDIYKKAKKLEGTTSDSELDVAGNRVRVQTHWGASLPEGMAPKLREHHKTDIYAGMYRMQETYAKATQSHYMTFRRVSDKSDPKAFIHPGIEARHLFDEAAGYVTRVAPMLLKGCLGGGT